MHGDTETPLSAALPWYHDYVLDATSGLFHDIYPVSHEIFGIFTGAVYIGVFVMQIASDPDGSEAI